MKRIERKKELCREWKRGAKSQPKLLFFLVSHFSWLSHACESIHFQFYHHASIVDAKPTSTLTFFPRSSSFHFRCYYCNLPVSAFHFSNSCSWAYIRDVNCVYGAMSCHDDIRIEIACIWRKNIWILMYWCKVKSLSCNDTACMYSKYFCCARVFVAFVCIAWIYLLKQQQTRQICTNADRWIGKAFNMQFVETAWRWAREICYICL